MNFTPRAGEPTRRRLLQASGAGFLVAAIAGCDALSTDPAGEGDGAGSTDSDTKESPMLSKLIDSGELPALKDRLPTQPLVVEPVDRVGAYGGEWRTALLGPADSAWLYRTVGYDQLMSWDRDFTEPLPNLAEAVEPNEDASEFTIRLREGIKWSDGKPFTVDDILFAYEDVLSNKELPVTVPLWLTADGKPATFEKTDELTLVVRFSQTHGLFLTHLAAPEGNALTAWARHYYEEYHATYNKDVEALAEEEGVSGWVELFTGKAGSDLGGLTNAEVYQNVDLPTLRPWVIKTALGDGTRVVVERNPYYWKTDPDGRQLPYIDRVVYDVIEDDEVMLAKASNGEFDMHVRHINNLINKPVLAQGREGGAYDFFDVIASSMNAMAIAFNLTHKDPVMREIFQNRDFRIGMSHAINRDELIAAVFQRQGEPWQLAPREETDLYDEEMAKQYTEYDVDLANQHLDQAGYTDRDGDDFRLGPDGKRIKFNLEVATGLNPFWTDALELLRTYWREVGVDMTPKAIDRDLFYTNKEANNHDANIWGGDGGLIDAYLDPRWFMPWSTESNWAITWANWYTDGVGAKEEPPAKVKQQMELYDEFRATADDAARVDVFKQILQIAKEEFWAIGCVLPVGDYGIVKNNFHNVPAPMPGAWVFPNPGPLNPEQFFISDEEA